MESLSFCSMKWKAIIITMIVFLIVISTITILINVNENEKNKPEIENYSIVYNDYISTTYNGDLVIIYEVNHIWRTDDKSIEKVCSSTIEYLIIDKSNVKIDQGILHTDINSMVSGFNYTFYNGLLFLFWTDSVTNFITFFNGDQWSDVKILSSNNDSNESRLTDNGKLIVYNEILYCFWIENDYRIYYVTFNNDFWSDIQVIDLEGFDWGQQMFDFFYNHGLTYNPFIINNGLYLMFIGDGIIPMKFIDDGWTLLTPQELLQIGHPTLTIQNGTLFMVSKEKITYSEGSDKYGLYLRSFNGNHWSQYGFITENLETIYGEDTRIRYWESFSLSDRLLIIWQCTDGSGSEYEAPDSTTFSVSYQNSIISNRIRAPIYSGYSSLVDNNRLVIFASKRTSLFYDDNWTYNNLEIRPYLKKVPLIYNESYYLVDVAYPGLIEITIINNNLEIEHEMIFHFTHDIKGYENHFSTLR